MGPDTGDWPKPTSTSTLTGRSETGDLRIPETEVPSRPTVKPGRGDRRTNTRRRPGSLDKRAHGTTRDPDPEKFGVPKTLHP